MARPSIQELNDAFRKGDQSIPGRVVVTGTIAAMSDQDKESIYDLVKNYSDFSEGNDPHGEHDFGSFLFKGQKLYWKIDYYDSHLQGGSSDPADISVTMRVLTIMLAREY